MFGKGQAMDTDSIVPGHTYYTLLVQMSRVKRWIQLQEKQTVHNYVHCHCMFKLRKAFVF